MVTQQILPQLRKLTGLKDLKISNRVLDDLAYSCDGQTDLSDFRLFQVDKVAVEHENSVQVKLSIEAASIGIRLMSLPHIICQSLPMAR